VTKGRNCMSGENHMEVLVQVFTHVHGFQWEQSHTYAGCSGNSRVRMRVVSGNFGEIVLIERCWIFATSGSHSPQESTRRPIYSITKAPRRS
jgi:hypothetical protein